MKVRRVIQKVLAEHPDVKLVQEIAMRARNLEANEPPREIGMATDFVAN